MSDRPASVVVIGWLWIVFGGFAVLADTLSTAMITIGLLVDSDPPFGGEPPAWFYLYQIAVVGFGALGVWAGWSVTQCRSWARKVLEEMTWLASASFIGGAVHWCITVLEPSSPPFEGATSPNVSTFEYVLAALGAGQYILMATIGGIVIYYLRSDAFLEAMQD